MIPVSGDSRAEAWPEYLEPAYRHHILEMHDDNERDDELRLVLGENVAGRTPDLDPRRIADWDAPGGYLEPPERFDALDVNALRRQDLALAGR